MQGVNNYDFKENKTNRLLLTDIIIKNIFTTNC